MSIHPLAFVDPKAIVPASCEVGPFCSIGADVELGENCRLESHVVVQGPTRIGSGNHIFPFAAIGCAPQDHSYAGEPTRLEIGDNNEIREYVTIHRGTVKGGALTKVGSGCLIMAYSHIAHDCRLGDRVLMANAATLGGHVVVGDDAILGALSPVHQFVRIGERAFIGGGSVITQDVLPFSKTCATREVHAYGANSVGLERAGFSKEAVRSLHHAFRILLAGKRNTSQAIERLRAEGEQSPEVERLIAFIEGSERGVIK